jgi:lipid A 3-O-deacylase
MTIVRSAVLTLWVLASAVSSASAADLSSRPTAPPPAYSVSPSFELRLGAFAHDPWSPEEGGVDVNGELLFPRWPVPADPFWTPFVPRLHVGGTVSTQGKTSTAYAGFSWTVDITDRVFVEASFGGALNNGATGVYVPDGRIAMGCNASFRESASIGVRLTPQWSILATVEHYSNAGLCDHNRGLTNVGARIGYAF